ncbi:MAG: tripartite tricarboxylate transporter substrate-binding protein [Pseudomonadota bacterium]
MLRYSLHVPAGTPAPIAARLNAEAQRVLALPEMKARVATISVETKGAHQRSLGHYVQFEYTRWDALIHKLGVKLKYGCRIESKIQHGGNPYLDMVRPAPHAGGCEPAPKLK